MAISEKKKISNKRWNDKNRKLITASLSIKEYELFKKYCETNNLTTSGLIKQRLKDIIDPY